jgi:hypothetical protein
MMAAALLPVPPVLSLYIEKNICHLHMGHEVICDYRPCRAERTLMHYAVPTPITTNQKTNLREVCFYLHTVKTNNTEL